MQKLIVLGVWLSFGASLRADPAVVPAAPAETPAAKDATSSTADGVWKQVADLRSRLNGDIQKRDVAAMSETVPQLMGALKIFAARYPTDPRAWESRLLYADVALFAGRLQLPQALPREQAEKLMQDIAANKSAPKEVRAQAILDVIVTLLKSNTAEGRDAAEARIDDFQKEFGNYAPNGKVPEIAMLREIELGEFKNDDPVRYQALLQKLASDPEPTVATMAQQELAQENKMADLKTKPLDLKFTAVDGTPVDLAKMRGKVVLIDFWATWCPPCRGEVPDVVAAYQKLHPLGFEIVGISLDQDKNALLAFTKENGMVWPQYFDGKGWDNTISKGFGIDSIPAMWLVNQQGMLVTTNARDDLAGQVEKLLKPVAASP